MSLQGSIEDLGVAELLYVVGVSRRSGLLRLEGAKGHYEILFREGAVVAARRPFFLRRFRVVSAPMGV